MIGLASTNNAKSTHYKDIVCGWYCNMGHIESFEYGSSIWKGSNYNARTVLTMRRQGTKVDLLQDGQLVRRCGNKMAGAVWADVSVHTQGRAGLLAAKWIKP